MQSTHNIIEPVRQYSHSYYVREYSTGIGQIGVLDAYAWKGGYILDVSRWGNKFETLHEGLKPFETLDQAEKFIHDLHEIKMDQLIRQTPQDHFISEFYDLVQTHNDRS